MASGGSVVILNWLQAGARMSSSKDRPGPLSGSRKLEEEKDHRQADTEDVTAEQW